MTSRTKVTTPQVLNLIMPAPLTIREVAQSFGVTAATARKHLLRLTADKKAAKVGVKPLPSGLRGRSPDLYQGVTAGQVLNAGDVIFTPATTLLPTQVTVPQ